MMSRKPPVLTLRFQRAALFLLLVCTATAASAQPIHPAESTAFQRAAHVRRGINLSMWYAQAPEYSAERLASFTTPGDFRLIKSLGFDHVRLGINPEPLIAQNSGSPDKRVVTLRADAMARLDQTVAQITATGLVVILDIHPEKDYQQTLVRGDQGMASFLAFWKTFGAHYAGSDPRQVYFEVLNEPAMADNARWADIQARAVAIIRAAAPHHTVIATGGEWGGIPGLLALQPVHDDNILYSFHDYDPMWFTHQGASWAGPEFSVLRNVPYPSSPVTVAPILNLETTASGKQGLTEYGQQRWNRQRMDAEISNVAAWGAQHRVPIYCGEFGVFRDFADPAMRARWLHDMRDSLEAHHIGWDMWDYQGGFALIVRINGQAKVDGPIATALGLKLVAPEEPKTKTW